MLKEKGDPEHRIQCSYRILIGPWDDKTPSPFSISHVEPRKQTDITDESSNNVAASTLSIRHTSNNNIDKVQANTDANTRPQPVTIQSPDQSDHNTLKDITNNELGSSGETNSNYLSEDTFHTAHSSLLDRQSSSDQDSGSEFGAQFENSSSSTRSIISNSSTGTIRPTTFMDSPKPSIGVTKNSVNPRLIGNQKDRELSTNDLPSANQHQNHMQSRNEKNSYYGSIPKIIYNNGNTSGSNTSNNDDQHERSGVEDITKQQQQQQRLSKRQSHQTPSNSLLWRASGPIFLPSLSDQSSNSSSSSNDEDDNMNSADTTIKHEFLLCMQLLNGDNEKLPTTYKERDVNSVQRQHDWRQLEVMLTAEALECYDSKGLIWPRRKLQYRIPLDTRINPGLALYILSPLDYTFCLQYTIKGKNGINTVVFRARSLTLCQEWYMALYQLLPSSARKPFPQECEIYIPSINLHVHLPLMHKHYLHHQQEEILPHQDRNDARYYITMEQIKDAVIDLLQKDRVWKSLLDRDLGNQSDLSLCWTRKDRLEWVFWKSSVSDTHRTDKVICPQLIEKTHQLELRTIQHTPNKVALSENITLPEPFPCEGFLTKVTDFEGRHIKTGSWVPRRFYFSSFGRFLFVISANKVRLPNTSAFMDLTALKHCSNTKPYPSYSNRVKSNPYVTLVSPYAGNKDHISQPWQHDEIHRRMKLISAASGCIDLAEVSYVQRSFGGYSSADALLTPFSSSVEDNPEAQTYGNLAHNSTSSSLRTSSTSPMLENGPVSLHNSIGQGASSQRNIRLKQQPCIELVMENGISLKLEASSNDTCDQWVSCLSDLVIYSKARVEADRDLHSGTKPATSCDFKLKLQCKKGAGVDSAKYGINDWLGGHSDATHEFVDTRIWSICPFTKCKDIVKSGVMYVQSKDTFSQKQFILTMDGRLHYYNIYKRSTNDGKPIKTGIHQRKGVLDMANAYVYSGQTAVMDWKTSKPKPDRPPRLFRDGMTAKDSDQDCLLTVWIPKRRRIFSLKRQRIMVYGTERMFNSAGNRWLFLTPSRLEKEEWVWGINTIQEHLHRKANYINNCAI